MTSFAYIFSVSFYSIAFIANQLYMYMACLSMFS